MSYYLIKTKMLENVCIKQKPKLTDYKISKTTLVIQYCISVWARGQYILWLSRVRVCKTYGPKTKKTPWDQLSSKRQLFSLGADGERVSNGGSKLAESEWKLHQRRLTAEAGLDNDNNMFNVKLQCCYWSCLVSNYTVVRRG